MITASWGIRIDRPPEQVFDFVADLRNEPQFNPDASTILQESPGPIGLGRFQPAGEGATDVSCTAELRMKGGMRLMEPMMGSMIRRQIEQSRGPMMKQAVESLPAA